MAGDYSQVNVSAHRLTSWFPSVADELNSLYAYAAQRENIQAAVGRIGPEEALRLNDLARSMPQLGPAAVQLAQAGYGPDHPTAQWAAEMSNRYLHDTSLNLGNIGTVVAPWRMNRGSASTRLRNAMDAANSAGMIDGDGRLHQPQDRNSAEWYLWDRVQTAAISGRHPIPYIDTDGAPRIIQPTHNDMIGRTMQSISAARQMEAHQSGAVSMRLNGFVPIEEVASQAGVSGETLARAADLGLINEEGYWTRKPFGDNPERDAVMREVLHAFHDNGIDLPFINRDGRPIITRNSEGGHWENLGPAYPEPEDPGGLMGVVNDAMGVQSAPSVMSDVAGFSFINEQHRRGSQIAGMALNAPLQEMEGLVRNAYAGLHGETHGGGLQSDLAIWLGEGGDADLGNGYFVDPDSAVARERYRREAERGQIAGQNLTTGRILANTVTEPGTDPYNILSGLIDFGKSVYLDPSDRALALGGGMAQSRRLFRPGDVDDAVATAGGLRGFIDSVHGPTAQAWLDGPSGSQVVRGIAEETSPYRMWTSMGRRVDPRVAVTLADTTDEGEVRRLLQPMLGTTFRQTSEVWNRPRFGLPEPSSGASRLMSTVPGTRIDTYDLSDVLTQVERWGVNARMEPDRLRRYLDVLARSRSRAEIYRGVRGIMEETDGLLANAGMENESLRRDLTRMFNDSHEGAQHWFVDEVGSDVPTWSDVVVGGDPLKTGLGPHLTTEILSRYIDLPDYRAVRRVVSNKGLRILTTKHSIWGHMNMTGEQRLPITAVEFMQNQLWKPFTLGRVAWPVRVIGEEQVRMAAAGRANMFTHPISFIAWRMGKKGDVDVNGHLLSEAEEHSRAMSRVRGGFLDDQPTGRVRSNEWTVYTHNPDNRNEYVQGWAQELSMLAADPVATRVARAGGRTRPQGEGMHDTIARLAPTPMPFDEARAQDEVAGLATEYGYAGVVPRDDFVDNILENAYDADATYTVEDVPIREVQSLFQDEMNPHYVRALDDAYPSTVADLDPSIRETAYDTDLDDGEILPHVARGPSGQLYIIDGRHRGAADAANRDGVFRARVYDVDDEGNFIDAGANGPFEFETQHTTDPLGEVMEWMIRGEGRRYLDELIASSPAGQSLEQPQVLRRYLETVQDRIRIKTSGNDELLDLVRTGRFRGKSIFDVEGMRHDPSFTRNLDSLWDEGPDAVKGQKTYRMQGRNDQANRILDGWNNAVDWAFGHLMSRRTNNLSRSPNFRQAYWQRMQEMAGYATDVDDLMARAERAGMRGRDYRKAAHQGRAAPDDRLSFEEMDQVAKAYALEDTKQLLYDLADRGQGMDAIRVIAPFGDAWQEVLSRWFHPTRGLIAQKPRVARRAQQAIEGANRSGVFYENENNELVFTYPGSEFMTDKLLGVPIPMTGRAEGLSFMTQVIPGLGPAAQIPVAALLANQPDTQWLRDALVPFGGPTETGDLAPATDLLQYAPPWMQRAFQVVNDRGFDAESNRQWANSQMRVAQYLSSTGDYDLEDPGEFQRLMEDSANKARWFYAIRSFASFVAPSAPAPEWLMQTNHGNIATAVLTEEYRRLQDEDFDTADDLFLERHGPDVVLSMTPLSRSLSWGVVPSREHYDWTLEHPELVETYPSIYGLFGPQSNGDDADFEYGTYLMQFETGARESLTPNEWARLSQHLIATRIYNRAKREVGDDPTPEDMQWLREGREWLRQQYPGYENLIGIPQGPNLESAMIELRGIINEPGVRGSRLAGAVRNYLAERDWAESEAEARGFASFTRAEDTADLRDYLRQGGAELSRTTPGFERIYDLVLSRELDVDEEEQVGVG